MADSRVNSRATAPACCWSAADSGEGRTTWDETGDARQTEIATITSAEINVCTSPQLGTSGRGVSSIGERMTYYCQVSLDFHDRNVVPSSGGDYRAVLRGTGRAGAGMARASRLDARGARHALDAAGDACVDCQPRGGQAASARAHARAAGRGARRRD